MWSELSSIDIHWDLFALFFPLVWLNVEIVSLICQPWSDWPKEVRWCWKGKLKPRRIHISWKKRKKCWIATMKSHSKKRIPDKNVLLMSKYGNFFRKNGKIAWEVREMSEKWGNCVTLTQNARQLAGLTMNEGHLAYNHIPLISYLFDTISWIWLSYQPSLYPNNHVWWMFLLMFFA